MGKLKINGELEVNSINSMVEFPIYFNYINNTCYIAANKNLGLFLATYGSDNSGKSVYLETYDTDVFHRKNGKDYAILTANNYNTYAPTKTGTGASGTWSINITGSASLLALHNNVTSTSTRSTQASTWTGSVSGISYVYGQAWKDTSISSDTGDLVLGLRPSQYDSGATELCMMIDGDYYSMGYKVLNASNYSQYAAPASHSHSYLSLGGGSMNSGSYISFPSAAASYDASVPTALSYGRLSCWGTLCINANTDNSGTEYVLLTAGKGLSSTINDGLAIGTSTLTWQGSNVITAANLANYSVGKATLLEGFYAREMTSTWGAVSSSNYTVFTQLTAGTASDKGGIAFMGYPTQSQISVKIDGFFFQNEGSYMCLDTNNYSSYALPKSGGTVTGALTINGTLTVANQLIWPPSVNFTCTPTANSQEWSIDVGSSSYTGSYFHVWSARNGCTILQCNADNNSVGIPNGPFYVGASCYGPNLPGASYVG